MSGRTRPTRGGHLEQGPHPWGGSSIGVPPVLDATGDPASHARSPVVPSLRLAFGSGTTGPLPGRPIGSRRIHPWRNPDDQDHHVQVLPLQ